MAIQQGRAGSVPPSARPAPEPGPLGAGYHAHVASLIRGFEVLTERINGLDVVPLDLLERFARALNQAEQRALARVQRLEKEN